MELFFISASRFTMYTTISGVYTQLYSRSGGKEVEATIFCLISQFTDLFHRKAYAYEEAFIQKYIYILTRLIPSNTFQFFQTHQQHSDKQADFDCDVRFLSTYQNKASGYPRFHITYKYMSSVYDYTKMTKHVLLVNTIYLIQSI